MLLHFPETNPAGTESNSLTPHSWQTSLGDERLQLLDEVGRALTYAADWDAILQAAALPIVQRFAELAVLVVRRENQEPRIEVAHRSPARRAGILEMLQPLLPAMRRAAEKDFLQGREFRWIPKVSDLTLRFLRGERSLLQAIEALDINSLIVVPLRSGGSILGALALARMEDGAPFHAADLATAQVIARRTAVALQRAELHGLALDEHGRRTRLEGALQKWIQVFDHAGWGAAIVDGSDRRIEAVNPAFARLHGYAGPESLGGRLFTDILAPDRVDEPLRWSENGQGSPYESLHVRVDGAVFPVLTNVTPITGGSDVDSYVVTIQDLTELKRTEERLRRAQRLEAVGRLAGGVAHEVNNMMTIILGFSDLLSRSGALPPERQRDVEEIRKAAGRAGKTTQQLLAFSRQQILQPTDLDLNGVVKELLPALQLLLPANIVLETSLSPLGGAVRADRAQLDQVLINLAFNARDAMPGGGTLRLATASRWLDADAGKALIGIPIPPGQYATVSVIDTGHGMDRSTVTQVFEPFFTTKPVGSGTGLGLATVYGIVKQSGGYVWVESTPGQGTTVTVSLPQVQRPAEEENGNVARQAHGDACRGGTILIVEDEDGVRDLARRVLEEQGHKILEARNGPEALQTLERSAADLDLVLSDVIVPEIGTNELEQHLRRRRPELPILYMSGYSREEMVGRGLVPPDGPFLQKPFTAEELGDLVCRHLQPAGSRGEKVNT
jgi:two-component system, cell cycle sensor histidine kinase and response regulator CckA